ncbi:NUDIX domain-containing protein [Candidatus Gracilibacteria bacterium]|nr:NUDIX domain-containing protein [Candidatus Gracilibacteria bacterium]
MPLLSAICAGGFITKGNQFLLVEEKDGTYNFPMGNVEQNESIEDACMREVKEETGFEVAIDNLRTVLHIKRGDFYLTKFLFNVSIVTIHTHYDPEVVGIRFVTEEEFRALHAAHKLRSSDMLALYESRKQIGYYE